MSAHSKAAQNLARQLLRLSLENGELSAERVTGALEYVVKHRPANSLMVLKAYRRLAAAELARGEATVEHAGAVSDAALQSIEAAMGRRYRRRIFASARPNPALIAGLRVRVADDVFDASIAAQLSALAASV
ncbi:MAG: F0F1 ATP synthase subunit delta [Opitutaceae bacterium]